MDAVSRLSQGLVNGLVLGSVYALIALGYSMVYGVLRILNFAHGEVFMVCSFAGWLLISALGGDAARLHPALLLTSVLALSMAAGAALGLAVERVAYRPHRKSGRLAPLLSAIGVSIFLQNVVMLATQGRVRTVPTGWLVEGRGTIAFGNVTVPFTGVLILAVSTVLTLGLQFVVRRTRAGRMMRAVSEDMECASYVGIPVDRVIAFTFALGSALAGAAGVLVGLYYTQVDFAMGFSAGMKAFTAAVLGGIGSLPGAVLGGLVLGIAESLGTIMVAPVYKDAIAFGILILALVVRPNGILGENVQEKV
ncbi:MAG: branched-chain amino acid ABC transporter permease, partial [Bacillota bacterium]